MHTGQFLFLILCIPFCLLACFLLGLSVSFVYGSVVNITPTMIGKIVRAPNCVPEICEILYIYYFIYSPQNPQREKNTLALPDNNTEI